MPIDALKPYIYECIRKMIKLGKAYNNNKKLLETLLLGDLRTFYKLGNPHLISCNEPCIMFKHNRSIIITYST